MGEVLDKTPYGRIWLAFFAYTCLAAVAVQFFVLPVLLPQWHDGNGLFNFGDFERHHRLAVELSQAIQTQGWGAWVLRPEGQANAGIAGAIYALTVPKPWTLIPLNAALHATAALSLLWLIQLFLPNWRRAIWCALPFLLYPTSVIWYAQNLKDGYSIAGFLLFLCGWVAWMRWQTWRGKRWFPIWPLGCMALGAVLIWIVRPYVLQMMQGIAALLAVGGVLVFLQGWRRRRLRWFQALIGIGLLGIVVLKFTSSELLDDVLGEGRFFEINSPEALQEEDGDGDESGWNSTGFLPASLEGAFFRLAQLRQRFIELYPQATSNIDTAVSFHSVQDLLTYAPKAALIALLYPLPAQWPPGSEDTAWTRPFVALEMAGLYVWLPFSLVFMWQHRRRVAAWMILCFCVGMMTIYALAIPNLGSLYRVRYGFIMTLAALGIVGLIQTLKLMMLRVRAGKQHGRA